MDTSAYSIATVASKNLTAGNQAEPHLYNRIIWAIFLGAIALALMYQDRLTQMAPASGAGEAAAYAAGPGNTSVLTALKTSSLVVALPLMICIFISVLSFLKWLKEDKPHLDHGTLPPPD